jgi:photoactive yellow protein
MNAGALPTFDEPQLARAVEQLPPKAIDALPFGSIRLAADGTVQFYSKAEARLSGYGTRPALGRHFFTEMAPCMDHPQFRGRVERAMAVGTLDIAFGWYGDFEDPDRPLRVRVQSAAGGGVWIFIQREG